MLSTVLRRSPVAPVMIAGRAGAPFRAFDAALSGTIVHVEPKQSIVQNWRSTHFLPESIDSVPVLSFDPEIVGGTNRTRTRQNCRHWRGDCPDRARRVGIPLPKLCDEFPSSRTIYMLGCWRGPSGLHFELAE
jgi:hypothetical protein